MSQPPRATSRIHSGCNQGDGYEHGCGRNSASSSRNLSLLRRRVHDWGSMHIVPWTDRPIVTSSISERNGALVRPLHQSPFPPRLLISPRCPACCQRPHHNRFHPPRPHNTAILDESISHSRHCKPSGNVPQLRGKCAARLRKLPSMPCFVCG